VKVLISIVLILITLPSYSLPTGDTVGKVTAVRVVHSGVNNGKASFQIFFENQTRDRFGCLASDGYILVREDGFGVTIESFKMMFSIALAAQASGKVLAVDSSGTDPCINANIVWMEN
jgi:hypothetical protein